MKMIMALIPRDQSDRVLEALISAGYGATFTESRGGMLRQAQKMLFIAAKESKLLDVIRVVRESCRAEVRVGSADGDNTIESVHNGFAEEGRAPVTAELGGAVIFVWDLERFETY